MGEVGTESVSMPRHGEPHEGNVSRLNWLRAGVLGANDGIVSTASLVVGVAGATSSGPAILTAGVAGLFAGAASMGAGEYVSVSSQRDAQRALLVQERVELAEDPQGELDELAGLYREKGLDAELAARVAEALTEHDALAAHAEVELGIDTEELANPWQAALASFVAFTVGALLPLLAMTLTPASVRIPVTVVAVIIALAVTGSLSARFGGARRGPAIARNVLGGLLAMAITYGIGALVGHSIT